MEAFKGTGVALVTPFHNGSVHFESLERLIDHVAGADGGVDYIVSLGSTGESILLTEREKRLVLDFTVQHVDGRLPVIAGNFGDNNTSRLTHYIEEFDFRGIDGMLSSCPSYVRPTQEGLYLHYKAIAEASPVPVIMYNVPGRTSVNMSPETACRIGRDCLNIIGVKEASGLSEQGEGLITGRPEGFLVLSGDDPTAIDLIGSGGDGVISVIANLFPHDFSKMVRLARAGELEAATQIHIDLFPWHSLLYAEGNPAGIKAGLYLADLISSPEVRLPLTSASHAILDKMRSILEKGA